MWIQQWHQRSNRRGFLSSAELTVGQAHLIVALGQPAGAVLWQAFLYAAEGPLGQAKAYGDARWSSARHAHPCSALDDLFEELLAYGPIEDLTPLARALLPALG